MDTRTPVRMTVLAVVALSGLAPPASAAAKPFTPSAVAGSYTGMWNDSTFGTSGPFGFTIKAKRHDTVLVLKGNVGGQAFGCPGVPPIASISLTRGRRVNHWNAAGFRLARNDAFGNVRATYDHRRGTIRAAGTGPPSCAGFVSYVVTGTLRHGVLNGTADITLPNLMVGATFHADQT
jgi:hypothetical protein